MTSYLLKFEPVIYRAALPLLVLLEKCHLTQPPFMLLPRKKKWDIVICGFHRMGHYIYRGLPRKTNCLVMDYDPDVLLQAAEEKIPFIYGDVSDADVLHHAHLRHARLLVSTVPDTATNMIILTLARKMNRKLLTIVACQDPKDVEKLYDAGASYVVQPHLVGGQLATSLIRRSFSPTLLLREKEKQLRALRPDKRSH